MTAPTFDDLATICATDICSVKVRSLSWIVRSATWITGGSVNEFEGVTSPSESAALTGTILKVEPGSYVSVTARSRVTSGLVVLKLSEEKDGLTAIAMTRPLRGSSTMPVALLARHCAMVSSSTFCRFSCMIRSSARWTFRPSRGGTELTVSTARPVGSRTIVSVPGRPASTLSYWRSRPASPTLSTPA